jgi:hypothetical protein
MLVMFEAHDFCFGAAIVAIRRGRKKTRLFTFTGNYMYRPL